MSLSLVQPIVDSALTWAEYLGLPVLFLIFVSKGMLVGKIFPTSVFLPGYVLLTRASVRMAIVIAVVTAIGYIIGQYFVYWGVGKYGPSFLRRIVYIDIDPETKQFERLDAWFARYGGPTIFVTNFVPWIRGLATIPAATSSYPRFYYLLHTTVSTILYHIFYVAIGLAGLELFF